MALDIHKLVDFQKIDSSCNCVYPWYTHGMLEFLEKMDLSKARVLEFGGGWSTVWWRHKAAFVATMETSLQWATDIQNELDARDLKNGTLHWLDIESDPHNPKMIEAYLNSLDSHGPFDIIVNDGSYRNEVLVKAIAELSKNGGLLIADNWQQDQVWISEAAEAIMAPYEITKFVQPDHTNHSGRPWTTACWQIPKAI